MRKKYKTSIAILLSILTFVCLSVVYVNRNNNPRNKELASKISNTKAYTTIIKKKYSTLSCDSVIENNKNNSQDTVHKLQTAEDKLREGFNLAFNNTHNQSDYNKLKKRLPRILGNNLGHYICNEVKPQENESGGIYTASDHLNNLNIATTTLSFKQPEISFLILVDYNTPKIPNTRAGDLDEPAISIHKYDVYSIKYDTLNNNFQLVNTSSSDANEKVGDNIS